MAHWMAESKGLKDGVLIQGRRTFGTSKVIKITYMHLLKDFSGVFNLPFKF